MSAFGIFEWRDVRYPALRPSADYISNLWTQTAVQRHSAVDAPVAEVVVESCPDLFLTQLAGFIAKHGRDLQVLLVMAHGDQDGLMQSVESEHHVSYSKLWEVISETFRKLWQCPQPEIVKRVDAAGKTFDVAEEDIGDGAGHGLMILCGACRAMGSGNAWFSTPGWIGSVVGYSGEPNKCTIENLFVGLSLEHSEKFHVAVDAFRSAWKSGDLGLSVISESLNKVVALLDQLDTTSHDPHPGIVDPEEGELRIWQPVLRQLSIIVPEGGLTL